jgi:hypothetical protein
MLGFSGGGKATATARQKRTVIARIEARTAEVIVIVGSKTGGNLISAAAGPSSEIGVAALRAYRRKSAFADAVA